MKYGDKIAIVCCSNGKLKTNQNNIEMLETAIKQMGLVPIFSPYIYAKDSVFSGTGIERANALMKFYKDPEIKGIFDISGGDIANEVLPYLDFELIANSDKMFWGYSDLTTIINAIYAKTGKTSVLYQISNLIYKDAKNQIKNFSNTVYNKTNELFTFEYTFLQGEYLKGTVIGGNIRCFLKLAGSEYWPDMKNKVLLLEAFGGMVPQMTTYLCQLKQLGVFDMTQGILLGTFTYMEKENCKPSILELVQQYAGDKLPIAITHEIGHGVNSKGIMIGEEIYLER